jgi:putative glutamine amidotransferase
VRGPLIALVSYHLDAGRVTHWDDGAYAVPDLYVDAVRRAGGRPVLLPGPDDVAPDEILERFDALLLVGGGDVDPARYGAGERHRDVYGVDPERDELEIDLLRAADRSEVPTLAICRGIQVMNVAFGGTLHQHLPDVSGFEHHRLPSGEPFVHDVKVSEGTRLAQASGSVALRCWSAHHQGVDEVGEGLAPVGWSDDGLVEALERDRGWMLAVQWHPERTAADDPTQQALFDALVVAVGRRS